MTLRWLTSTAGEPPPIRYNTHNTQNPMAFAIYVTETVVSAYEFETEAEARQAMDDGDFWHMEAEVVDGDRN